MTSRSDFRDSRIDTAIAYMHSPLATANAGFKSQPPAPFLLGDSNKKGTGNFLMQVRYLSELTWIQSV